MVCGQVIGNDVAIGFGAANGHFELNVFKPMIIDNFLQSANLMGDMVKSFYTNCLIGIQANEAAIANYLDQSLMLVTALTPHIGYEKAAQIAKTAFKNNTTLKEETLKLVDNVDEAKVEEWLNPAGMLGK